MLSQIYYTTNTNPLCIQFHHLTYTTGSYSHFPILLSPIHHIPFYRATYTIWLSPFHYTTDNNPPYSVSSYYLHHWTTPISLYYYYTISNHHNFYFIVFTTYTTYYMLKTVDVSKVQKFGHHVFGILGFFDL